METGHVKKTYTDEERLALAAKLDKELDDFIDGLEKSRYKDGWPEDKWEEEMAKHPFFMKKAPEPGDELHPLLEGIQQLKYDPEENTTEELALRYKEDGNFYMKHKKFRMAVLGFSEGIKLKCNNSDLNAILYNNRSAAQFFLKNYRSSLFDAEKALKTNPDYVKAKWRAAQCNFHLNRFEDCIKHCEEIIEKNQENKDAANLLDKCKKKKLQLERDERKRLADEKRKATSFKNTLKELQSRGVKFDDIHSYADITVERLNPSLLPLDGHPVRLDENGSLLWPAAFSYPEFLVSDFQQSLDENIVMGSYLEEMLGEAMPQDKGHKYKPGSVSVYYENRKAATVHKVDLKKTIKEITQEKSFYVTGGCLLFYVVPTESEEERKFINAPRRPLVSS